MIPDFKRILPFLAWWPRDAGTCRCDAVAGVSVALVLVPQSLAYAQLAGLPPHYGLYAALIPGVVGALWGSSAHLATGPVATVSLLTAATLQTAFPGVAPAEYARLAVLLALLVGAMQLALGLLRWSGVSRLLPASVLKGFVNAAALVIIVSQLHKLGGVISGGSGRGVAADLTGLWIGWRSLNFPTLGIGLLAVVTLVTMKRLAPRAPGALAAAGGGGLIVFLFGLDPASGGEVAVVGRIDQALPRPALPYWDWEAVIRLLPGALAVAATGFMEATSIARSIAVRSGQRLDLDQEMIGQGLAGLAGGCCGSFPVSGSFSRSALNYAAGAKTGMSSVIAGGVVLLTLLFLTRMVYYLPLAVLAGIIMMAVWHLIDLPGLLRLWRENRGEALIAWSTLLATLYWSPHLDRGIVFGVLTALAVGGWRRLQAVLPISRHIPGGECVSALDEKR